MTYTVFLPVQLGEMMYSNREDLWRNRADTYGQIYVLPNVNERIWQVKSMKKDTYLVPRKRRLK